MTFLINAFWLILGFLLGVCYIAWHNRNPKVSISKWKYTVGDVVRYHFDTPEGYTTETGIIIDVISYVGLTYERSSFWEINPTVGVTYTIVKDITCLLDVGTDLSQHIVRHIPGENIFERRHHDDSYCE